MAKVKKGWKLGVISPEGEVVAQIDIGDYDLSKSLASSDIIYQLKYELDCDNAFEEEN